MTSRLNISADKYMAPGARHVEGGCEKGMVSLTAASLRLY